jgi:hypothetical protein
LKLIRETIMTRHKHADVLIALAEGREVEYLTDATGKWCPQDLSFISPINRPDLEWRVKPVPVITYEWLLLNKSPEYAKSDSYIIYSGHVPPAAWDFKITFEDGKPIKVEAK